MKKILMLFVLLIAFSNAFAQDYEVLEDDSIVIGTRPTTDEERREIENEWYQNIQYRAAVPSRIAPTKDIGLFIDSDLFANCLVDSEINNIIIHWEAGRTDFPEGSSFNNVNYETYYFDDGTQMICLLDQYNKYSSIGFYFPSGINHQSNYVQFVLREVLDCTGLPYGDTSKAIVSFRIDEEYVNDSYGITSYIDDRTNQLVVDIYSSYWFYQDNPYSRVEQYYGYCDGSYVGACVPNVSYDLDCSDIGVRNFFVIGRDAHNFDSDGNGVCCEPYPG